MKTEGVFTVPEYYPEFQCKGGACRHTCCSGLAIDITEQEYYALITLDCSPALRDRIDLGVRLNTVADANRYAKIQHNYLGDCKMLDEDGLCALQRECGPEALNRVCRYYPRSPRIEDRKECSMSNSCEKTLEILFMMAADRKSFRLTEQKLLFDLTGERAEGGENAEARSRVHRELTALIADDSRTLEERLREIEGKGGCAMQDETAGGTARRQIKALSEKELLSLLRSLAELEESLGPYAERAAALWERNMAGGNTALRAETAAGRDTAPEKTGDKMTGAEPLLSKLRAIYPEYDRFLTLVLANDLFYRNIPYGEPSLDEAEERKVFAVMARLLVLLSAALVPEQRNPAQLIDLFACFFRLVDLTSFDRNLYILMKRVTIDDEI